MNSKKKQGKGAPQASLVRSSAAEYLTFVAASGQGGVAAVYAGENVWLTQKMMGLLYDVDVRTINYHLKKVFSDRELEEKSVIQFFRITAADGKSYDTQHYNLAAIIAVGYKVNSERAVQFRKWATGIIEQFTIKGFAMDDERLKNDGSILGKNYFEEQLQRIREIRLSERKFYQKITDIYATAIDYDVTAQATQRFFATVQNKLHWAIHAGPPLRQRLRRRAEKAGDRRRQQKIQERHMKSGKKRELRPKGNESRKRGFYWEIRGFCRNKVGQRFNREICEIREADGRWKIVDSRFNAMNAVSAMSDHECHFSQSESWWHRHWRTFVSYTNFSKIIMLGFCGLKFAKRNAKFQV
ncbi:MAG TPA: RhuM family protein [Verrucomicrobiae bacterium]|jgi:hypothetical protein|nr:RhuM family protein [Verrucomicrobiae bacterium]